MLEDSGLRCPGDPRGVSWSVVLIFCVALVTQEVLNMMEGVEDEEWT